MTTALKSYGVRDDFLAIIRQPTKTPTKIFSVYYSSPDSEMSSFGHPSERNIDVTRSNYSVIDNEFGNMRLVFRRQREIQGISFGAERFLHRSTESVKYTYVHIKVGRILCINTSVGRASPEKGGSTKTPKCRWLISMSIEHHRV